MRTAENSVLFRAHGFTNQSLSDVLPDHTWDGRECFIVGGGPSLHAFDWSRLKGKRTIGVNRAYEFFDPTILFSMDTRFLNWVHQGRYGEEALKKFNNFVGYKVWLCTYTVKLPDDIYIVRVYKNYNEGLKAFTFTSKNGIGHGNNSGYGALNLAVCLGANPIYLLGFDCRHENGRTHFHNGHPVRQKEETTTNFIKYFTKVAKRIEMHGTRVINLNPQSALTCFPRRHPSEVL